MEAVCHDAFQPIVPGNMYQCFFIPMIRKTQKLNNGIEMPTVGLGTWMMTDPKDLDTAIRTAIRMGYRHIDTAFVYGNEETIGRILKKLFDEGTIKREELFITSKLWNTCHDKARKALEKTLKSLQLDYVDLYIIHWPVTFKPNPQGEVFLGGERYEIGDFDPVSLWREMESFVDAGLAKSIGFSNFGIANTKKILETCRIRPAVSQFEMHPYLTQKELVRFMKSENIQVVSYSSLGSSAKGSVRVKDDENIKKIAEKYKRSPSQIILSYITMQDICVIPRSVSEAHIRENIDLEELEKEDFDVIDNLNITQRYVDPVNFGASRFE